MDVFSIYNNATNRIAIIQKQPGAADLLVVTCGPEYTDLVHSMDIYSVSRWKQWDVRFSRRVLSV